MAKFRETKFAKFCIKAHLNYLFMALLLYGLKAGLYFIIAAIPCNPAMFDMQIDKLIPLIPEFYIFYLSYYILPEIFIWILSFYDKKKVFYLVIGAAVANVLCFIAFLIKNVKMDREQYEILVAPYRGFKNITNIREFFYACLAFQYDADSTALNCFPSIHATFGTMLALTGIPLSKKENHFPLWMRIFCIVFGLGIVMSTFFVKQHYFIDAIAGMVLMTGCFFLAKYFVNKIFEKKKIVLIDNIHEKKIKEAK